ncbi:TIR domain-containing protein [Paucidesulfovibrio gracilis DSM 16080]|uniref:TIR domain-containing protein n=1 Tax=Paucidesulfovibrio gracilis DSM 16080 TaxID=1121449 RepID=A0A1T4W1V7_9BACT|nr:toll/interleukin-1 receptor domain-containing protein [Paucidesulfovibrio gracilis]SKA71223.1 TIR domain-containing protein [Paucidesulfovibrio gracilis DSM 16080]
MLHDIFISHASEDKDKYVRGLAEALEKENVAVWYDEFSLKPGDSLRRSIDLGLSKSRFGIVVLSPSFLAKKWPEWELDGLVQRQNSSNDPVIIPVWLDVSAKEIINYSPSLADKYALQASAGVQSNVQEILKVVKPQGSSLVVARDRLLSLGYNPPVVTDDWWHKAIEYTGSNELEGTFQDAMGWGRWGFPLPENGPSTAQKGERIAWAVLQTEWMERAEREQITQITHPDIVHDFINSSIGLEDRCGNNLHYLATYAPQTTIRGCSGLFEEQFDAALRWSQQKNNERRQTNSKYGSALTTDGTSPRCDEFIALRDDNFGFYGPATIACFFVQGHLMGPEVKFYDTIDYLVWMLSDQSYWLPKDHRSYLIDGMKQWGTWDWEEYDNWTHFPSNKDTGALSKAILKSKSPKDFKLTPRVLKDIKTRFQYSVEILGLDNSVEELVDAFIEKEFISDLILKRKRGRKRRK